MLRASIHQRLSLYLRFIEGLDAAEQHALAAVGAGGGARGRRPARLGAGRARADPLQRGEGRERSSSPTAPTRSPPRRRPRSRSTRVRARPHPRLVGSLRPRPRSARDALPRLERAGRAHGRRRALVPRAGRAPLPASSSSPASTPRRRAPGRAVRPRRGGVAAESLPVDARRCAPRRPRPRARARPPDLRARRHPRRAAPRAARPCSGWSSSGAATPRRRSPASPPPRRSATRPTAPSRR